MQGKIGAAEERMLALESELRAKEVELNGVMQAREILQSDKVHP